jgi:sulfopyruvate decarboxylase alpha subunit
MRVDELDPELELNWPEELHRVFRRAGVGLVSYVPDAGHSALIESCNADPAIVTNVLTTEEEGIAIATGAWLGGTRSAVLMQSSGVGNCINMLSLPVSARVPLLLLVTMRGEWAEFNPWQNPMGRATQTSLEAIGVTVLRADTPTDVVDTVDQATTMAYDGDQQIAVLIGQRLLGRKKW